MTLHFQVKRNRWCSAHSLSLCSGDSDCQMLAPAALIITSLIIPADSHAITQALYCWNHLSCVWTFYFVYFVINILPFVWSTPLPCVSWLFHSDCLLLSGNSIGSWWNKSSQSLDVLWKYSNILYGLFEYFPLNYSQTVYFGETSAT